MTTNLLEAKFVRIGARLKIADGGGRQFRWNPGASVRFDVNEDRDGEFFTILRPPGNEASVEVLDVQPAERHLLVLVRDQGEKSKYLCGHDERHWFVAAVPESAPVGTVRAAKEALKPPAVLTAQARAGLRSRARNRRKNAAYRRQGEWFFLPAPELVVDPKLVLRHEPIRRGSGKAHWAEFCYRTGGETVYVCPKYPNGLGESEYRRVLERDKSARSWNWRPMQRDAAVYVRGEMRHPDHRTITLPGWHRVWMNTENQARAMQHVAFLD